MTAAWVLGQLARGDEALALLRDVNPANLGEHYTAEAHLTRASLELSLGHLDAAAKALLDARATTARASTERNVLLEAELAWRRQDTAGALRLFERAAAHHWKWQGGAGLLRHGQLLRELGREAAAREVWERCRRQDPESLAAQRAAALLGA